MDKIERILRTRKNRKTRIGRPYQVFAKSFGHCLDAGQSLLSEPNNKHAVLLERAIVITTVSSIEVYYKDVLNGIFNLCSPSFFLPHLKNIHSTKYDIAELIEFDRNNVHPFELISANQSFQSAETIDSVFAKFLGKSLWTSIIGLQLRVNNRQETECEIEPAMLNELKKLFTLRHELVHDQSEIYRFSDATLHTIACAALLVLGSDIVLGEMITKNSNPDLPREIE